MELLRLKAAYIMYFYKLKTIVPRFTHLPSSLAKGYDPLYSSSHLASLVGFS